MEVSISTLNQDEIEGTAPFQQLPGCYNINVDEDDDLRNVNIIEYKGEKDVEGPGIEFPYIGQPLKVKKVKIGIETKPNMASI